MAFSFACDKAGFSTGAVDTTASVRLVKQGEGFGIDRIALTLQASVPGIGAEQFQQIAQAREGRLPVVEGACQRFRRSRWSRRCGPDGDRAAERIDDGSSRRSRRAAAHAQGRALQRGGRGNLRAERAGARDRLGAALEFRRSAGSEQRFRDALATSTGDDALICRRRSRGPTVCATTFRRRAKSCAASSRSLRSPGPRRVRGMRSRPVAPMPRPHIRRRHWTTMRRRAPAPPFSPRTTSR
jgi:hypothetical protein